MNKVLWDMELLRSSHVPEVHGEAHSQNKPPNPVFSVPGWQVAPNELLSLAYLDMFIQYDCIIDLENGKPEFVRILEVPSFVIAFVP